MTEMAKRIEVIANGGITQGQERTWSLLIDGEEFPWHVSDVELTPNPREWPAVRLTIPAHLVTSRHAVGGDA